jgi:hypothetical protein
MSKRTQENLYLAVVVVLLLGVVCSLSFLCFHQYDLQWRLHLITGLMVSILVAGALAICAVVPVWLRR